MGLGVEGRMSPHDRTLKGVALRYANKIRAEYGLSPLTGLLPGKPHRSSCCALANTVAYGMVEGTASVGGNELVVFLGYNLSQAHPMPDYVVDFTVAFDYLYYPELIKS